MDYTMPQLLKALMEQNGSDLHITPDTPPRIRIDGHLMPLDLPPLSPTDSKQLCYSILTEEQKRDFENDHELDVAFSVKNVARFRANIYTQKGCVAGAFRIVPFRIFSIEELGLPPIIKKLCQLPRGLVLVTGPTGSGKSTTLASMIDYINSNRYDHIVTIEDPIEFVHPHKKCMINQREIGHDTMSFARALKSALRQDPDVVMVGEMRDLETIALAITTAETGHLVFGTLHTNSCISSLNRIIDVFPPHQQNQIRQQIAQTVQGIISQLLHPVAAGGRALSMEIMIPNIAIRNLIRENKFHQIYSSMQTGQDSSGMQTMNQSLFNLLERRKISAEYAISKSENPQELQAMIEKIALNTPGKKPFKS